MTVPEEFDFLTYCDDNGIEYRTHAGNLSKNWLCALNCPFCGETNHKLGIPPLGNRGYCWSCGGKNLFYLLRKLTPEHDYNDLLEKYAGYVSVLKRLNKSEPKQTKLLYDFEPLGKGAKQYLLDRGFDPDYLMSKYNLRWGGTTDPLWKYRIIIPIYFEGVLVSWQGRSIARDINLRYITLAIEKSVKDPKSVFFNWDNCNGDTVIVTEGPFDCMRLGDNSLATLGTSTTEAQIRLLSRYKKVIIMFDSEVEALKRAKKFACSISAMGVLTEVIDTELSVDIGATPQNEVDIIKKELLGV